MTKEEFLLIATEDGFNIAEEKLVQKEEFY